MATTKITDLTAYTDPISTDVVPIVDVTSDVTKKVSIADLMENAGSGSAAAPGISFDGDPNTGIYRPGADQVAISTGGTGRLFVDSAGLITTDSSFKTALLNVVNPNTVNTFDKLLTLRSPNLTTAHLGIGSDSFYIASVSGSPMIFCTNSDGGVSGTSVPTNERMRITSDGKLGLGTSSPGALLNTRWTGSRIGSTGVHFATSHGDSSDYDLLKVSNSEGGADASTKFLINGQGQVGIGTTPVDKKLTILGTDTTNSVLSSVSVHLINDNAGAAGRTTSLLFGGRNENADPFAGIAGIMTGDSAFEQSGHLAFYTKTSPAAGAPDERARIDSSGRLLVGTSTARANFYNTTISALFQQEGAASAGDPASRFMSLTYGKGNNDSGVFVFAKHRATTVGGQTVVVDGDRLGELNFQGSDGTEFVQAASIGAEVDGTPGANDMPGRLVFSTTADGASSPTQRMTISANGTVTINEDTTVGSVASSGSGNGVTLRELGLIHVSRSNAANPVYQGFTTGTSTPTFEVIANGDASFDGAVSKGSGSFKISHPLPEKTDTHYLYHSFIEGPQADLIYRGHVQLVNGTASVNIDEAARMTEGTFEALCTNVCCFTSNESDWTAVRGSVSGNILTIEAQDPASTADICWMVVGERKDQHMLDTGWTDANGRVITERLKSEVDSPVEE